MPTPPIVSPMHSGAAGSDGQKKKIDHSASHFVRRISKVPIVNFIYFIVEDDPDLDSVNFEGIRGLLATLSTITALLLGVSSSVLHATHYDELKSADDRYRTGEYSCGRNPTTDKSDATFNPSVLLARRALNSIFLVGIALITSSILFMSVQMVGEQPKRFDRWWYYMRYWVAVTFVAVVAGTVYTLLLLMALIYVKFPNYYLQEECEKNVTNADTLGWDNDPFGKIDTNPNILAQFWANLFLIPISIIVVWVAGYAMRPIDDDKPVEEAPKNQFGFGLETGGVN
eukprot:m.466852 g.466852  ORF g.466852 m.466852 type:complete len:285 (+) comp25613_c0_seq1:138-992(+)